MRSRVVEHERAVGFEEKQLDVAAGERRQIGFKSGRSRQCGREAHGRQGVAQNDTLLYETGCDRPRDHRPGGTHTRRIGDCQGHRDARESKSDSRVDGARHGVVRDNGNCCTQDSIQPPEGE